MDLFPSADAQELRSRQVVRVKNCRKHNWFSVGTDRSFVLKGVIMTTIKDLYSLNFGNYKICTKCGLIK